MSSIDQRLSPWQLRSLVNYTGLRLDGRGCWLQAGIPTAKQLQEQRLATLKLEVHTVMMMHSTGEDRTCPASHACRQGQPAVGWSWRLTALCVVQDGRLVSELTEAQASAALAASGPQRGGGTARQRALRQQVGSAPSSIGRHSRALLRAHDGLCRAV